MDLFKGYQSEDSQDSPAQIDNQTKPKEEVKVETQLPAVVGIKVDMAPQADISDLVNNKNYLEMTRFERETKMHRNQNHLTGFLQSAEVDKGQFRDQMHSFQNKGYALNPSDGAGVNSGLFVGQKRGILVEGAEGEEQQQAQEAPISRKAKRRELKQKRQKFGEAHSGDFQGPWALYEGMGEFKSQQADLTEDQKNLMKEYEDKRQERLQDAKKRDPQTNETHRATSIYHGSTNQFAGGYKSFIEPPSYLRAKEHETFLPKKWLHTWNGHDKGVQRIQFFPKFGHLLLSASHDGTVKIWDVLTHRKCLRTYMGHTKAVRDIQFTNDGKKFLSAGFDKVIQLWDTETGKVIRSFTNRKTPFCVKFHPSEDKQHIFLAGCANKKILQFDTNSKDIVQQYEEHLGSINTLTFIENGRRFVSTADDKKVYVWEFGIPVVAKHISEPDMHAIPATTMHPNGKYFAGQSMDNKIVVYDSKGNFKLNRKKVFTGHMSAGYACGLRFSPDGQFLCSGDSEGRLWFWNWKTCKNYRTLKVHDQSSVTIDVDWHPVEPSKVATCSWDGTIKLWD